MSAAPNLSSPGKFDALARQEPDALLSIIKRHALDPRPGKLDLGIGVYRDESGATPIFAAVKEAERRILAGQTTKAYLGAEGDIGFTTLLAQIALGEDLAGSNRIVGVQTPGGSGALRLGAELLARAGRSSTVWLGTPTWPNHAPMFREAGLAVREYSYFDTLTGSVDFGSLMTTLARASAGDTILLQGCCHNPSGADLSADQWKQVTGIIAERGLFPFIDIAYQGLAQSLDCDAQPMRRLLDSVPDALVAYSCDKNFGLYRERVGALWARAQSADSATVVRENLLGLARSLWSMPPDHGAACVRVILEDVALSALWRAELAGMVDRLVEVRTALGGIDPRLAPIADQFGLFALLPIKSSDVEAMRHDHAIYMAGSGRINVAGLNRATLPRFMAALVERL